MRRRIQAFRNMAGFTLVPASDNPQARFALLTRSKLLLLAAAMTGLWYLAAPGILAPQELLLWEKVRAAQLHISNWRKLNNIDATQDSDPWNCGLIGVEWSGITTTLGDLSSKRSACNPTWAIQFQRWFQDKGLKPGDPIAIYSSASFPGLLLNAISAAETMELDLLLVVSLGASTWGANHPESPWPLLAAELRRGGYIQKRADFYTLGGGNETGEGMAPEGVELLRKAAQEAGVELLEADSLGDMVALKAGLLKLHQPRLLVSIGGSHANLGNAPEILKMQIGPVPEGDIDLAGNGVIAAAMQDDIPVLHMLNIKSLSGVTGIPYDSPPRKRAPASTSKWWSGVGVVLFIIVMLRHRRWRLEPGSGDG